MKTPLLITLLAGLVLAAPAAAKDTPFDHVEYRADLRMGGTWAESVRAGLDEADTDGDGREEVAARDQQLTFAVTSSIPRVAFRGGRVAARTTSIQHGFPTLTVDRSTLTEPNGETGGCRTHQPGTGGSAELVRAGGQIVFRPAEDVIFQLVCSTEKLEWGFAMDAMRAGGAYGEAALDASFDVSPAEIGTATIVREVSATAAQASRERCPQEDPGHTVACSFGWSGTVVLQRTDAARMGAGRARLGAGARTVSVEIVCRAACSPALSLGATSRRVAAPAGTSRAVLPLTAATRRALLRTGRGELKVRLDGRTRSFPLRARRAR